MNAVDTNIWIYCYDARDPDKHGRAKDLVSTLTPMVLIWQVGCEFLAAARKLEQFGFSRQMAWQALQRIQAMSESVSLPTPPCGQPRASCMNPKDSHSGIRYS